LFIQQPALLRSQLLSSSVDVALLLVDILKELVFIRLSWLHLSVLADCLFKLTINLHLSKGNLLVGSMSKVEDTTIVLVSISFPH